jgi:hypothetical protein
VAKLIYRTKTDGVTVGTAKKTARLLGLMTMKASKKANPYLMAFHVGYGAYNAYNTYQETGDLWDSGVQFVTDVVFRRSSNLNGTANVNSTSNSSVASVTTPVQAQISNVLDSEPLALDMEFAFDSSPGQSAEYDEAIRRLREEMTLDPR